MTEALLITSQIKVILNKTSETFVIYLLVLETIERPAIYLSRVAQMAVF